MTGRDDKHGPTLARPEDDEFELGRPLMMFLRSVPSGYQCHFDEHTFIPLKRYCEAAAVRIERLEEQLRNNHGERSGDPRSPAESRQRGAEAGAPPSSTREKPQEPVGTGTMFHWRDYIFFGLKDDGTVRIKQYANNIPPASPPWADEPEHQIGMVFDISIPAAEWQSILGFTAPGLIKDRKSIVAMTGLLAQARRERDTALSAIEQKRWDLVRLWLIQDGGPRYIPGIHQAQTIEAVNEAVDRALRRADDGAEKA